VNENISIIKQMCRDRLAGHASFAGVDVLSDEEPDIRGRLDQLLKGHTDNDEKAGAAVVVSIESSVDYAHNDDMPMDYLLTVTAHESRIVNRDPALGVSILSEALAREAYHLLKNFCMDGLFQCQFHETPLLPLTRDQCIGDYGFRARLWVRELKQPYVGKVQKPVASTVGIATTITCATTASVIYYTLNGRYPSSANSRATYTSPINIGTGATLMALAEKDGWIPSDVLRLTT
jgi:hypothetical protein